jgi:adenosine deaminase
MQNSLSLELLRRLPKAELHCHLDGALRPSTVHQLSQQQQIPELKDMSLTDFENVLRIRTDCTSLVDFLKAFQYTLAVLQESYAITRAVYEAAEDAAKDGVRYLELRFCPLLHTAKGLSAANVLDAACEGVTVAELRNNIRVRLIVCAIRNQTAQDSDELAELCLNFAHNSPVVSFDLAGPELGFPPSLHLKACEYIRGPNEGDVRLSCTIHCGEAAPSNYIIDAIRSCRALRIGHGVTLKDDAELQHIIADRRIPVEICLTSNLLTKAVSQLSEHPLRKFFDAGVLTVLCTDNPLMCNVSLSDEYFLAQNNFGFTPKEMIKLSTMDSVPLF